MFWYFFTYDEFDHNIQAQHNTKSITTMVVVPLQRHGLNQSVLLNGWVALCIPFPRPLSKDFV
jgi:hypothetical protein